MNLTHHFLMAMPGMQDPHFSNTLTYICEHGKQGALGLIINKPLDMKLGDLMQQVDLEPANAEIKQSLVYEGGPIEPSHGLVLHRIEPHQHWQGTLEFSHDIGISSSLDILEDLANEQGPTDFLIALGHAGWAPGQLEAEFAENAWLSCPADNEIIFNTPSRLKLACAAALLGVDLSQLSSETGHA